MTITGRVPLLVLLGGVAVAVRPLPGTAWLWLAAVLALTLLDVGLAASPRALELRRTPPAAAGTVRQGQPTSTQLTVRNTGRRTARGVLRDAWQPTAGAAHNRHPLRLPRGATTSVATAMRPERHGELHSHVVTVRSCGPLGLGCRQRSTVVPGVVRALPPFHARRHLPGRLAMLRELDGRSAVRTRGQGTEFDSLREYVRGDDVRSIDWRATARTRSAVVRTWQPERDRRVVIVLDTSRAAAARVDDAPRFDAALEAALLLAALASRAGDRVDLVAGDARVRTRFRVSGQGGAGGSGDGASLLRATAGLQPVLVEADWSTLVAAVDRLGRQRSLVVLLTAIEPAVVTQGLLPVLPGLTSRHHVVVAAVQDPALGSLTQAREVAAATYAAAAAERSLLDRGHAADLLRQLGADVLDAEPEELPVALADHYLMLKARGLL